MKNAMIFFLIGAIAGAVALHLYENRAPDSAAPPAPAASSALAKARDAAGSVQDSISNRLQEWKLTPADIKQDLARTGQVVRTKAQAVGARMDDARIVTVIKAKYVLDSALSARAISVECHDGEVTLAGTAGSADLVGRAVALALDTNGVHNVVSHLTVQE